MNEKRIEVVGSRAGRTAAIWADIRQWCEQHPGEKAAIVTPTGSFTICFETTPKRLAGVDSASFGGS